MTKLDMNEYHVVNYDEKGAAVIQSRVTRDRKEANTWAAESRWSCISAVDYMGQTKWEVISP